MDGLSLRKVDLHCHSTFSDGTFTPSQIVELARERGISHISLTDHDTVSGIEEAIKRGRELGVNVIPGIEVTADTSFLGEGRRELHILGYHFNPDSPSMRELTEFFRKSRIERNRELCFRLEEEGYPVNYDSMVDRFGENFGKPNLARVLIELGYFSDRERAIDFLSSLGVKRRKMDYGEVLDLITESRGIPVVAHPVTLRISHSELYCFLKRAKERGLRGIEVYHYRHKASDVKVFREMAEDLKLLFTGGSDFHGKNKPCVEFGMLNLTEQDVSFPLNKE
ncbi:MAG: phosphatase [Thermovibrio sp.]|nr:MAG: phosphatase [Thermovibrio sp.]